MIKTFASVWSILNSRERWTALLLLLANLVAAVLDVGFLAGTMAAFGLLFADDNASRLDDLALYLESIDFANAWIAGLTLYLVFAVLISIARSVIIYFVSSMANQFELNLTLDIYKALLGRPSVSLLDVEPNEMAKKILADVNTFIGLTVLPILLLSTALFSILGILIFIGLQEPVTILFCGLIFLICYFLYRITGFYGTKIGHRRVLSQSHRFASIYSGMRAHKDVRANDLTFWMLKDFQKGASEFAKTSTLANTIAQLPRVWLEFVLIFLLVIFGILVFSALLPMPEPAFIAALGIAILKLLPNATLVVSSSTSIRVGEKNMLDLIDLIMDLDLRRPPRMVSEDFLDNELEEKGKRIFVDSDVTSSFENGKNSGVEIKGLTFRYGAEADYLFENFNISLSAGKWHAFVGRSGRGKTTLLDLIFGLIDGDDYEGIIVLGFKQHEIAYALQSSALFSGSIAFNICLDSPREEEFLSYLLLELGLSDAVAKAGGLDASLSGMDQPFSGGQLQRLMVARILYRRPKLILMDEITSSLDQNTATDVLGAIRRILPNSTAIIVTHSPLVSGLCDNVWEI